MSEEVEMIKMETEESMQKAVDHFVDEMSRIRAGKANPSMLNTVMVEAYGAKSPLNTVASVNTPDARTLMIQPFDKSVIEAIEKAIVNSNLGFNPMNDGSNIRINIPTLTEERRQQLVKVAKSELEDAKVSIRNARKDAMEAIKNLVKDGLSEDMGNNAEVDIQTLTDNFTKKAESLYTQKEADIMKV